MPSAPPPDIVDFGLDEDIARELQHGNDGRSVGVADEDRRLGRDASQVVFWGQNYNLFCRNR